MFYFFFIFSLFFSSISHSQTMKLWLNSSTESYTLPQDIDSLTFSSNNNIQHVNLWKNNSSFIQHNLSSIDSITFQEKINNNDITDIDGNLYQTVSINGQIWLKQNLRTTTYNDGTPIPKGSSDGNIWVDLTTPTFNWYEHDSLTHADSRGALYNWWAASSGKLCPTGWKVASKDDYSQLIGFLGGEEVAGGKMKEVGEEHWADGRNVGATNESGFTGIPGGYRAAIKFSGENAHLTGLFTSLEFDYHLWTSTEATNTQNAWKLYIADVSTAADLEDYVSKKYQASVRCLKN